MIKLETTRNQYKEEVIVDGIYFDTEQHKWFREQLNCWSCEALGMGTCGCHSHDPYSTWQISAEEVKQILAEMDTPPVLSEEEERALNLSMKEKVEEALSLANLSLDDLNRYATTAYRLDVNPLPSVRKFFKDAGLLEIRVDFAYYQDGLCWDRPEEGGPHLICYLDNNQDPETAWFEWNC